MGPRETRETSRHAEQRLQLLKAFLLRCEAMCLVKWTGRLSAGKAYAAREWWAGVRTLENIRGGAPLLPLSFYQAVLERDPYEVAREWHGRLCAELHASRVAAGRIGA